jgi:sugar phosphate isomerase/epimerase
VRDAKADLLAFGLDVEIMCEPPHAWPAPVPWTKGRVSSLHAPILGINIASTNPGIRRESVGQIVATIHEAARLGATGVVVHPGIPPYEEILPRESGLPFAIESLRRCAEEAQTAGVYVYLENMPAVSLADGMRPMGFSYGVRYDELRRIFEGVGHPSLRLCLDLGHGYLAGMDELRALLGDRDVVHVHLNDNRGWRDDHLAWGDGAIAGVVDLARDLPPSVQTIVLELGSLEACAATLARISPDLAQRGQRV